jgi:hypothetical protein
MTRTQPTDRWPDQGIQRAHRFGKPTEGVPGSSRSCAIVLHGPGFREIAMLARPQPCWAVVNRLVGIAAAARTPAGPLPAELSSAFGSSSCADYFTLNFRHVVLVAAHMTVLAIMTCRR